MNIRNKDILIVLIMLLIIYYVLIKKNYRLKEGFRLFGGHPIIMVPTSKYDELPWHARLNETNNPMWISHRPPRERYCYGAKCHPKMDKNMICWKCY